MSQSDKPLATHEFAFGGHTLQVECRRLPEEVSRVTQTLQLDVEELFASLLDWDIGKPEAGPAAGGSANGTTAADDEQPEQVRHLQEQGASQQQQQQQAHEDAQQQSDSKKLCGNVAADQPDLIGLDVWPASIALCRYLASTPALAAGISVCELGAGMGLPGLLCAKLGAAHVLLTDYEPVVVDQMRRSAERNGVAPACSFLALDWFDHARLLAPAQRGAFDLLLLADVIYAAAVVGPLVGTLRTLLRPGAGVALVAHRIRRPLIFDRVDKIARLQEQDEIFEDFKAACQAAGLRLRFLNDSPAAQAGEEPLLLAIGESEEQLQRFPLAPAAAAEGGNGSAPAAASSSDAGPES